MHRSAGIYFFHDLLIFSDTGLSDARAVHRTLFNVINCWLMCYQLLLLQL